MNEGDDLRKFTKPIIFLWSLFFLYTAVIALFVQLVIIPYLLPAWHAGNGLLVGGDWLVHHQIAVELAQAIHVQGWGVWQLRPEGQAPAGIAAAVYALTVPEPWTLIFINAALHATATLILFIIVQRFVHEWRRAIWAVLPFLLYPSAMTWYTQILKDGYSIAGSMMFLYGWFLLGDLDTSRHHIGTMVWALVLILTGGALTWIVRPYNVHVMLVFDIALLLFLSVILIIRALRLRHPWPIAITRILMGCLTLFALAPFTSSTYSVVETAKQQSTATTKASWKRISFLLDLVEGQFSTLAKVRYGFRTEYPDAMSNVDIDVSFNSAGDVIAYLPRAAQIGFLAPFPDQWFAKGSLAATTLMRRILIPEMLGVYLSLAFLPYALWRWRRRLEIWLAFLYCGGMVLILGLSIPNVGALYRLRYGFLMTLVALGLAGLIAIIEEHRLIERISRYIKQRTPRLSER